MNYDTIIGTVRPVACNSIGTYKTVTIYVYLSSTVRQRLGRALVLVEFLSW